MHGGPLVGICPKLAAGTNVGAMVASFCICNSSTIQLKIDIASL